MNNNLTAETKVYLVIERFGPTQASVASVHSTPEKALAEHMGLDWGHTIYDICEYIVDEDRRARTQRLDREHDLKQLAELKAKYEAAP